MHPQGSPAKELLQQLEQKTQRLADCEARLAELEKRESKSVQFIASLRDQLKSKAATEEQLQEELLKLRQQHVDVTKQRNQLRDTCTELELKVAALQ